MRISMLLFLLCFTGQYLHAQNWMFLKNGEKIAVEWAGRSKSFVEYAEQGAWKVLPKSEVKRINFQPGKWAIGISYMQSILGDPRKGWAKAQSSSLEDLLAVLNASDLHHYREFPFLLLDFERQLQHRLAWGVQLGYSHSSAYMSISKWTENWSEYHSVSSDWDNGLVQGYVKWYDPGYHFFVFGGPGFEIFSIDYRYFYDTWNSNGEGDHDFISINNDPVKIRPSIFGGGGLYLIQQRKHALSLDAQVRFSGRIPVYIFERNTAPIEPTEKATLLSSCLRITYSLKFN